MVTVGQYTHREQSENTQLRRIFWRRYPCHTRHPVQDTRRSAQDTNTCTRAGDVLVQDIRRPIQDMNTCTRAGDIPCAARRAIALYGTAEIVMLHEIRQQPVSSRAKLSSMTSTQPVKPNLATVQSRFSYDTDEALKMYFPYTTFFSRIPNS